MLHDAELVLVVDAVLLQVLPRGIDDGRQARAVLRAARRQRVENLLVRAGRPTVAVEVGLFPLLSGFFGAGTGC
ncbi:hypothetical protein ACFXC9_03790 [Streptomyces naganishii]|uniref:hypothetical protein n=1 Tax=Streptomyces naganishii TaxID=285447 RepID=UPI00369E3BC2